MADACSSHATPAMRHDGRNGGGELKTTAPSADTQLRNPFVEHIMASHGAEAESSGDETTALAQRIRGGKRSYSTNDGAVVKASGRPASTGTQDAAGYEPRSSAAEGGTQTAGGEAIPPRQSWWKEVVEKYGTIELENKGSVARDHLALERTFLAWLRTSLSFASIGIAVTQLFRLNQTISNPAAGPKPSELRHVGKPLGATFIAIGILVLVIGFHRYFESQYYVRLGKFPASRASIALISLVSGALIFASLIVIVSIRPATVA